MHVVAGEWNDNQEMGDGGNSPEFPLCQTATFNDEIESHYLGCYVDSPQRDMQGMQAVVGGDMEYFDMGDEASPAKCAELCAGYMYFGLQYGNQCFCDNDYGGLTEREILACDTDESVDHFPDVADRSGTG
eukprot:SAG31_NODE_27160_length_430_cov_1.087613_1_plen_130_part_01